MFILLLTTLLLNTVVQQASCICNPHTGPTTADVCVYVEGYDQEQCARCITTVHYRRMRPKCAHNKHCLDRTRNFCYYTCMLHKHEKSEGLVNQNCQCRQHILTQECYSPSGKDCEWYKECLEKRHPCFGTNDAYAIEYGYKYCKSFEMNYHNFSSDAQKWIDDVRLCLQRSLIDILNPCKRIHCSEIKREAFYSHRKCYISPSPNSSICFLPFTDKIEVIKTIIPAFLPSGNSSAVLDNLQNAIGTVIECVLEYDSALRHIIQSAILIVLLKINRPFYRYAVVDHFESYVIDGIVKKIPHLNTKSRFKLLGKRNYNRIRREKPWSFPILPLPSRRDLFNLYIIDMYWLNDTIIPASSEYQLSLDDISSILNNSLKLGLLEFNITNQIYYIEEISYCYDFECANSTNTISAPLFRQKKSRSFKSKLKWVGSGLLALVLLLLAGAGMSHR